eukprot:1300926-Pyramimonas_sp.AAC.1
MLHTSTNVFLARLPTERPVRALSAASRLATITTYLRQIDLGFETLGMTSPTSIPHFAYNVFTSGNLDRGKPWNSSREITLLPTTYRYLIWAEKSFDSKLRHRPKKSISALLFNISSCLPSNPQYHSGNPRFRDCILFDPQSQYPLVVFVGLSY